MNDRPQQISVGDHVQIGSFHRWYTVVGFEEPTLLVLESDSGARVKADRCAISAVRRAQGLARMAQKP